MLICSFSQVFLASGTATVGWIVWGAACLVSVWGIVAFYVEVRNLDPSPVGPQAMLPIGLRRLIMGAYALGFVLAVLLTILTSISKLHLLWFIPLFFFFGTQWITWVYLRWPNSFPAILALIVGVLLGALAVTYPVGKYIRASKLAVQHREGTKQYMEILVVKHESDDPNFVFLESQSRKRLDECEGELRKLGRFWVRYDDESGWWYILSVRSFILVCFILGGGGAFVGYRVTRVLLAHLGIT